jgi:hypothetical protein
MRVLAILLIATLPLSVMAQDAAKAPVKVMTEDEIRAEVTDSTISGRYTFGGFFTEYHAADGRVLGHNGWTKNSDACWTTRANSICYSYGPVDDRQTYCFTLEKNGDGIVLRTLEENRLNGFAKIEKGNPRNHTDGGDPWNCQATVSELKTPKRLADLFATVPPPLRSTRPAL